MKKFLLTSLMLCFICIASSQEKMVTRTINGASAVKVLQVKASVNVVLDSSCADKIVVKVAQSLESSLFTELKGNSFTISYKGNVSEQVMVAPKATLRLSPKSLEYLLARGDGTITFKTPLSCETLRVNLEHSMKMTGKFTAKNLYLKMGNTSNVDCDVTAGYFDVSMSGVSRLTARGEAAQLKLHESANARASLDKLQGVNSLDLSLKGNANALLNASGVAKISLSGSSRLTSRLSVSKLELSAYDSAAMTLSGKATEAIISQSGRNSFPGGAFSIATKADVKCSGATSATLNCSGDLSVKATGNAKLKIPTCGGVLTVNAQNEAKISYPKGTKLNVIMVKDQATLSEL
ncbi:MAG: DUF2807 domain-containing protein [Alistipes sp.]|nr:DUF2807 domain-containing protein [Candidatus Alistipes equi]